MSRDTILLQLPHLQIKQKLKMYGYTVVEANSGAKVLNVCKQFKETIHLLVTDVLLPTMSGRELAEEVVKLRPEIRVIFISGYPDDQAFGRGLTGINFIQKPFSPVEFAKKIRSVLDSPQSPK